MPAVSVEMGRDSTTGARRGRVALVLDAFNAPYQAALVSLLREACERRGLSLVAFPGGVVGGVSFSARDRNRIYQRIDRESFDALVVLSGTMTREVGLDVLEKFCARFRPMPMCSIGSQLQGVPSFLVDNAGGIRALARHLIHEHRYRTIGFVGGPVTNQEANERLRALQDELAQGGLELHPGDVVHGDFMSPSGQAAVETLLVTRGRRPDAIIAANDAMAMGVLEALTHCDADGASEIAVCGFDNVLEADFCSPPLTTVAQPFRSLAEGAVQALSAQLEGQPCDELTRFVTAPVFRRSCGCGAEQAAAPEMRRRTSSRGNSVLQFLRRRDQILAELKTAGDGAYASWPGWEGELLDAFIEQTRQVPTAKFLSKVQRLLQRTRPGETWRFHNVLTALRRQGLPCVAGDPNEWARAEDSLQVARTLTGEAVLRNQAKKLLSVEQQYLLTNNLGAALGEAQTRDELCRALGGAARDLRIRNLVAVEFLDGDERRGRVFFSTTCAASPSADGDAECPAFLPAQQWPADALQSWVALPLFFQRRSLGYLAAELCLADGAPYEGLRLHVSAALWAVTRAASASPARALDAS